MKKSVTLVECPRDAMQGWKRFIPTRQKIEYLNALLKVGFDVLDFGSFVSPKAIPQLADTKEVIAGLDLSDTRSRLLAIIANTRGAEDAVQYDEIHYLGFPFSISETFQQRNTNKSISESLTQVETIQGLCDQNDKELVIYISMGFGNPYGDPYTTEIAMEWVRRLVQTGVRTIALSDTVGLAQPGGIQRMFSQLIPEFPEVSIGAHFHSHAHNWEQKIETAFQNGCFRFDSALKGIGGCPMAKDDLVGNIATENLIIWCEGKDIALPIDKHAFIHALQMASRIFEQ